MCKVLSRSLLGVLISTTAIMPSAAETVKENVVLEDKLYRQALYFYFTGNYGAALNQISINRERFDLSSPRSQLFEAGLQVHVGLHSQATESLQQLQQNQGNSTNPLQQNTAIKNTGKSSTSPEELMLIALLQLAEQQVQQGDYVTAQQTIKSITRVSEPYRDQYKVLNQLAYWPDLPPNTKNSVIKTKPAEADFNQPQSLSEAYIQLNHALLQINQGGFDLARQILTGIKNASWFSPNQTFWQQLFSSDTDSDEKTDNLRQQQALNDYAKLLLAQMYSKQNAYEAVYFELKDFPQDSPYRESALFLFAFSAEKVERYTLSRKLFSLLTEQFPYSNLGWQSALLLAKQVTEQMSLEEGMTSYQNAELLYQQRLVDLQGFHQAFISSEDLLTYALNNSASLSNENSEINADSINNSNHDSSITDKAFFSHQSFSTDSVWLQKAILDPELQGHFQTLIELTLLTKTLAAQQQKVQWLNNTLSLNSKRRAKVIEQQQQRQYRSQITQLNDQKQHITNLVNQAELQQEAATFADPKQAKWLDRIEKSKRAISAISGRKNTTDYKQRLQRIEGVLNWQLQQAFPERLWQHKKQLKNIEKLLVNAQQQSDKFDSLAQSQPLLSSLQNRINTHQENIALQLSNVGKLNKATHDKIQGLMANFVNNQKAMLGQNLLTTRHEMAAVLESMAKFDKRIEAQLAPERGEL